MAGIPVSARLEIEDLLSEFAARVDEGRGASVHELFVEAGRVETPHFVLGSREEIRERFTARAKDATRKSRHYWSNAKYSGSENEITVVTNVMTVGCLQNRPTLVTGGSSTDVVVRQGSAWAFKSRRLEVLFEGTLGVVEAQK